MSLIKLSNSKAIKHTSKAGEVWKNLNGLVVLYKPLGISMIELYNQLKLHLCTDLNSLETRPPRPYIYVEGTTNETACVKVIPSYADHELVVGPRHQPLDLRMSCVNSLTRNMSGVTIIGINNGIKVAHCIKETKPIKCFKVKGILGQATNNYFIRGKIVEKSTFKHVKRHHIDMICATMQSSHQKSMFEACGIDIQSQAAYDLAVQGLIRPLTKEIPLIYSIKCIDFEPPEFTLEIVSLNTNEDYLKFLINNLGLLVRSNATCSQLQCYQVGLFTTANALLKRDWFLQPILDNMFEIKQFIIRHKKLFHPEDPILREYLISKK